MLVIDNEQTVRDLMRRFLAREGRAEDSPLGAIDLKGKRNVEVIRCLSVAT